MDIDTVSKVILITLYCLFSVIRIEYYRRAKKAGYRTVIEERKRYSAWLSVFICYEVFTFFAFVFFPGTLAWAALSLPAWARLAGGFLGIVALLWFVWIHQTLGNNLSARIQIKESQTLVTGGPYRWIRHPMYDAFFILHLAAFLLTANWFIGLTWMAGLTAIILLRVRREEAMLISRFGDSYLSYMETTGRFFPRARATRDSP